MALDLVDDPALIEEYKQHHRAVWPEIKESIRSAGILQMEIYSVGNRLFMMMDTADDFSFERKAQLDAASETVQRWEALMWKYQAALPQAKPGQKWIPMEKIFALEPDVLQPEMEENR
jgi:L-rhamnose mutarotase